MDLDRIERLLTKYWDCETTVVEEKELKAFFNAGKVPARFKAYLPLFRYYQEEALNDQLDEAFDDRVMSQIETSRPSSAISSGKKRRKVINMLYPLAKVAAVLLVMITAGYFVREEYVNRNDTINPLIADTFEDPREAYNETKRALMLISRNMNMGKQEAQKISVFHEARQKVKETEAY